MDIQKLKDKFFSDPDWSQVETLIRNYIEPLQSCLNIEKTLSNDEIATEVRGRQLSYKALNDFLEASHILTKGGPTSRPTGFN